MPRFDTDRHWARLSMRSALLLPVSWLFRLAVELRRLAFRAGWARCHSLPVPVIVIGNVTVGGTGKTPLTIWLVLYLVARGWHPGVVSRGYGGSASGDRVSEPVNPHSDPSRVGDAGADRPAYPGPRVDRRRPGVRRARAAARTSGVRRADRR
jgi:tetraacyldisaccharide 4'-kinase